MGIAEKAARGTMERWQRGPTSKRDLISLPTVPEPAPLRLPRLLREARGDAGPQAGGFDDHEGSDNAEITIDPWR